MGVPTAFTFTVTNFGPYPVADARGIVNLGQLADAADVAVFASQGGTVASLVPGLAIEDLGPLDPGASASIVVIATPTHPGGLSTSAVVIAGPGTIDPDPANNLALAGAVVVPSVQVGDVEIHPNHGRVDAVQLFFAQAVPKARAENLRNYRLTTSQSVGRHGARQDVPLKLRSARYDPSLRDVMITLAGSLPRIGTPILLVIDGPGSPGLAVPLSAIPVDNSVTLTINQARKIPAR